MARVLVDRELLRPRQRLDKTLRSNAIPTLSSFPSAFRQGAIKPALCWAHASRQFFELADIAANTRRGNKAATLIMTAKLNDINPQAWLADVLTRIVEIPQARLP
jgi:IS66 C-terminal element